MNRTLIIIAMLLAVYVMADVIPKGYVAYEAYEYSERADRIQACVDELEAYSKNMYDHDANDTDVGRQMKKSLFESWNNTCTEREDAE